MSHFAHDHGVFATIAALCGTGDPQTLAGILLVLLLSGLVGGFAHCGPMCGPFVLMQLGGATPALGIRRLSAGLLPTYHLGRLITYSALGAAAGGLGGSLLDLHPFRDIAAALLGLAALAFLTQGLKGIARFLPLPTASALGTGFGAVIARTVGPILRFVPQGFPGLRGLLLGLVLGFLPCGFLYAALIASLATGSALAGALAMMGFALGTVPSLVTVGVVGAGLAQRWRSLADRALPPIFLINALTLGGLALRMAA